MLESEKQWLKEQRQKLAKEMEEFERESAKERALGKRWLRQFQGIMAFASTLPNWDHNFREAEREEIAKIGYGNHEEGYWDFWRDYFKKQLEENVPFRRTNLGRRVSRWLKLDAIIYAPLFPKKPKAKKSDTRKN
jgi:hypothetical protein